MLLKHPVSHFEFCFMCQVFYPEVICNFRADKPTGSSRAAACYISEGGWGWRVCTDRCKEHCHHSCTFLS